MCQYWHGLVNSKIRQAIDEMYSQQRDFWKRENVWDFTLEVDGVIFRDESESQVHRVGGICGSKMLLNVVEGIFIACSHRRWAFLQSSDRLIAASERSRCNFRYRWVKAWWWLRHCASSDGLPSWHSWGRCGLWKRFPGGEVTNANETSPMTVITLIEAYQHKRQLVRRNPLVDLDAVVQPLKYESRFFLVDREITIEFQLLDVLLQLVEWRNCDLIYFNGSFTHWTVYDVRMSSMWECGGERKEATNHEIKLLNHLQHDESGGSHKFIDHTECFAFPNSEKPVSVNSFRN